jgi:homoserine trans-succinylase
MCSGSEGLSVCWGISAAVYVLFSGVSMHAIGQKALGRNHLHTSIYPNKHFYCMVKVKQSHYRL